ncbi:YcdB/YcdC domain-containing protein [Metabacillus malikii]|uniref:YcdB/YcdC repeated domain-containing protein n=1 Tax=Metabacillus malikii TaxID=1504265 RepID=A0ABT9ZGI2_9BACI|nr:YcdB/YcdC domain-containing protein [Metabacillus malikii]MDQ0231376.1 hypothetical protein [Metabacillus malikii]
MQLVHLRGLAVNIGSVTEEYLIEIEDFREESGVAFFCWRHKKDEDLTIIVEVDLDGNLLHLYDSKQEEQTAHAHLSEDKLKDLALSFVNKHYPEATTLFQFEKWESLKSGSYRLTYSQQELGITLPFTGFHLTISPSGMITDFRYDGEAVKVKMPESIIPATTLNEKLNHDVKADLQIIKNSKDLYINGDDCYRLVYNLEIKHNEYTAEGYPIHNDYDPEEENLAETEKTENLLQPKRSSDIYTLIGFDKTKFTKIREQDLGDEIATVWRENNVNIEANLNNFSMEAFFSRRNDGTIKMKHHRKTGLLTGVYSFLERSGPHQLSYDEGRIRADQLLFHLNPDANKFFRFVVQEVEYEDSQTHYHYEYRLYIDDFPVTFGTARISVNRTTGTIDHFMAPDIDLCDIKDIKTKPTITKADAINIYKKHLTLNLEWTQEYEDNHPAFYQLNYKTKFITELGEGAYIDAHTGEIIVKNY